MERTLLRGKYYHKYKYIGSNIQGMSSGLREDLRAMREQVETMAEETGLCEEDDYDYDDYYDDLDYEDTNY